VDPADRRLRQRDCASDPDRFLKETNDAEGTDGVHLFSHTYGCSQLGDDHINTRTMLQNMVRHPNAGRCW
jgi:altronate dehydratase